MPLLLDGLETSYRQAGSQAGLAAVRDLRLRAGMKIGELSASLRLYGEFGRPAAIALVYTDLGKRTFDEIRATAAGLLAVETQIRNVTTATWVHGIRVTRALIVLAILLGMGFLIAFGLLVAMLSLAGIPFTAGFYGKFLVFATAVQAHNFGLIGIGIITVGAGFYYYLRVVAAMYWLEPGDDTAITVAPLTRFTIGALVFFIFLFGIFPQPILKSLRGVPIEARLVIHK